MLKVECFCCFKELDRPGALLFSPPNHDNMVIKHHLCSVHYQKLMDTLSDIRHNIDFKSSERR